jgi:AcrR family transcriptional regulator
VRVYRMSARAAAAEATGARILQAAADAFGAAAYDQVSLEEIAAEAMVAVRTVVRRFGSKEQLFAEVAKRRGALIRAARNEAVAGDAAGAIRILVASYEQWGDSTLNFLAQENRAGPIGELVRPARRFHHAWVERVFGPLLGPDPQAARGRLAGLKAVTDIYTWKVLRRDIGLSRREVEETVLDLVERIVTDPRPVPSP